MTLSSLVLAPVRFAAASYVVRAEANSVAEDITVAVTVGRDYWISGDGQADTTAGNGDFLAIMKAALETHSEINTITAELRDTMRVRLKADVAYELLWTHANTTLDPLLLGWTDADTASDATQDAPNAPDYLWRPERLPMRDSRDRGQYVQTTTVSLSGIQRTGRIAAAKAQRDLRWELIHKSRALDEYAEAAEPYNTWQRMWEENVSLGRRLRVYDDYLSRGTSDYGAYYPREPEAEGLERMEGDRLVWWAVDLPLRAES